MSDNGSKKNNGMDEDSATKIEGEESSETVINLNVHNQDENINVIHGPEQNHVHDNPFSIRNENQQNNPTYSAFRSQNGSNHINQTMSNNSLPNQNGLREVQPRIQRINTNRTVDYVIHRSPINTAEQLILSPKLYDDVLNGKIKIVIGSNQVGMNGQQPQRRMFLNLYTTSPSQPSTQPSIQFPRFPTLLRPPLLSPLAEINNVVNFRNLHTMRPFSDRTFYNLYYKLSQVARGAYNSYQDGIPDKLFIPILPRPDFIYMYAGYINVPIERYGSRHLILYKLIIPSNYPPDRISFANTDANTAYLTLLQKAHIDFRGTTPVNISGIFNININCRDKDNTNTNNKRTNNK